MKSHLNLIWGMIALGVVAAAPALVAGDLTSTYSVNATRSHAPPQYLGATSTAASTSNAVMVALSAQALLLKEMVQQHQARAVELTQKNESEKAKWETELVNELQERSSRVQKSIERMSQPQSTGKDVKGAGGDVDDELVFVATVEGRLEEIHHELDAAIEESRALSAQVATNNTPEDIGAMSFVLGDNQKLVKDLQKEQLDLELRKLEFRAIRKATQK